MVKRLEWELDAIKRKLLLLSAMVEGNLGKAITALKHRDEKLAKHLKELDHEVDLAEVALEEECLKVLALHQPVAIDMRFLIGVLKINNDLERVGDLAVNISRRAAVISKMDPIEAPFDFEEMAKKARTILRRALDSMIDRDGELARETVGLDDELDAINRQTYRQVYDCIRKDPNNVEVLIHYLSVSRHLEHIGDYAVNIAEDVIYMIDGTIIRHQPAE